MIQLWKHIIDVNVSKLYSNLVYDIQICILVDLNLYVL